VRTSFEYFGDTDSLLNESAGSWFKSQSDLVRKTLESVDLNQLDASTKTTEYIRQNLDRHLHSWSTKVLFTSVLPPNRATSNYKIDYQLRNKDSSTATNLVSLELVFDNRQAIGTNLLKLETSARQFVFDTGGTCLSLIVAPSQDLKDSGYWDDSVATGPEYSWAIRKAYNFLLTSPLVLITVS
jgi:hypothetical protein